MRTLIVTGLAALALSPACRRSHSDHAPAAETPSARSPRPNLRVLGSAIQPQRSEPLAELLAHPERFQDRAVVVEGEVRKACSRRGCWMELAGGAGPELPGCRVTFKDYGFFVPTDSAGSRARVEARVLVASLDPAIVSHMESEGAHFASKDAQGGAREVRLVASGVELWR